jgi:Rrf2 family protein
MKNVLIKREYDYAIRICAYLAGHYRQGAISLSLISRRLLIPNSFARKIVHKLRQSDLIDSVQGKYGGILLTKDPTQISVLDVLKAMDYNSSVNECLVNPAICPLVKMCKIHLFFAGVEAQVINAFRQKKLSELTIREDDLKPTHNQVEK